MLILFGAYSKFLLLDCLNTFSNYRVIFYLCNNQPFEAKLDANGKVYLLNIPFFKNMNKWTSAYLLDESDRKLLPLDKSTKIISLEKGKTYEILFHSDEDNRQLKSLEGHTTLFPPEEDVKSLFGISMAEAIIFWITFPRIFAALSNITEDLKIENDMKDFHFLICPGSLKTSIFQLALSLNNFMKIQLFNSEFFLYERQMNLDNLEASLNCLTTIKSEIDELIKILTEYLRKTQQNKTTILLINELNKLKKYEKMILSEQEQYDMVNAAQNLYVIDSSKIFGNERYLVKHLEQIINQRKILDYIYENIDEMVENDTFNIFKVLNLLKLLKELAYSEIIHFIHANVINKYKDCDNELHHFKLQYGDLYEIWRITGATYLLPINFDNDVDDWESMKKEILDAQRVIETSFHEIMCSPLP